MTPETAFHRAGWRMTIAALFAIATLGCGRVAPAQSAKSASGDHSFSNRAFTLADGTKLPIEEWPETYEAVEWQPPLDASKAEIVVEYDFNSDLRVSSVAVDSINKKVYWFAATGGGRHGRLCRADYGGENVEILFDGHPLFPGKELHFPDALFVASQLNKIYLSSLSYHPSPGYSIAEANLDGSSPRALVNGLDGVNRIIVDQANRKIYWGDNKKIACANLDGTEEKDLRLVKDRHSSFAIDFASQCIYTVSDLAIIKEGLDGQKRKAMANYRVEKGSLRVFRQMILNNKDGCLYWNSDVGIFRAPLNSLTTFEQLTVRSDALKSFFAVDPQANKLFWSARNDQALLKSDLRKVTLKARYPAPPQINDVSPQEISIAANVTISGSGLSKINRIYWISSSFGKCQEGKYRLISGEKLEATMPPIEAGDVSVVILTDGGATVLLPRNITPVSRVLSMSRSSEDSRRIFFVTEGGWLAHAERRIAFVEHGGKADSGLRAENIFFVKNGASVGASHLAATIFHEPHAIMSGITSKVNCISVPAIRPSFVERLPTVVAKQ